MDDWATILIWVALIALIVLAAWGLASMVSRRAGAVGGAVGALALGGRGKTRDSVPHVYNARWDSSKTFPLLTLDEVGPEGRPLVIVPYRANPLQNRAEHLAIFIRTLRDRVPSAAVLVSEQSDDGQRFNRGQVFNAAVAALGSGEIPGLKAADYTHYVLSDVDLLPSHGLAKYYTRVPERGPLHLAVRNRLYEMPTMDGFFGGVVSITPADYRKAKGFPNRFWGWGGEDLLFRRRVEAAGVRLSRPKHGYIVNVPHAWGEQAGHARADGLKEMIQSQDPADADGLEQTGYVLKGTRDLAGAYEPPLGPDPPAILATFELDSEARGGWEPTSREESHAEVFDALAALAQKDSRPSLVWLVGPPAVGKTTLRYALVDQKAPGVRAVDVDRLARKTGLFTGQTPEERLRTFRRIYGAEGSPSEAEAQKLRASVQEQLELAQPGLLVLEGAVMRPGREGIAPGVPAETWLIAPAKKGSLYEKTLAERLRFRAERAAAGKTPPDSIWVPGVEERIPLAELTGLSADEVHARHAKIIRKAVASARSAWLAEAKAISSGETPGRVFEV